MNHIDLFQEFYSTLPAVRAWIEKTIEDNKEYAVPVEKLDFAGLRKVFPHELLMRANVVLTRGRLPFPPFSRIGLSGFEEMENMPKDGIAYKDTFFVDHRNQSESLHFHELVHVVQWERLGVENFLIAYGAGLIQFGYADSPLEKMAYSLQDGFNRNALPVNVIELIEQKTDEIWGGVISFLSGV